MPTFSIENFGCRATDADAASTRAQLCARGFVLTAKHSAADIVVLNTCTVTAAADSQAREAVRKIHRANPQAQIVVTGCYAQRAPEELAELAGVACIVGNSHQSQISEVIAAIAGAGKNGSGAGASDFVPLDAIAGRAANNSERTPKILTGDIFDLTTVQAGTLGTLADDRTRPILKIQDGCNNRCSYCVIPFVRGRSRSLPPDDVVSEIHALVRAGAKEIVLSGINLGSYGRDLKPRVELNKLARRILNETSIERLRFSSIEPQDITEEFVSLVASSERIARHFHVPLQSGSDRILRAMHRWYRTEHYAERIALIRKTLPDAGIGADVIAGFPGESEADFQSTVAFTGAQPFTYLHVFSFSERPGTEAVSLGGRLAPEIIRERARHLRAIGQKKAEAFRASQSGSVAKLLSLHRGGADWTEGLTGNYLKVRILGRHPANEWHETRLGGANIDTAEPLAFENDLSQRKITAVSDRNADVLHA